MLAAEAAYQTMKANMKAASYVYFIECDDGGVRPIKIGYSFDPIGTRLVDLQIGSPWPLKVMFVTPGHAELERSLHAEFLYERMRGEWFRPSRAILRYILNAKRAATLVSCPDHTREIDRIGAIDATAGSADVRRAIYALDDVPSLAPAA